MDNGDMLVVRGQGVNSSDGNVAAIKEDAGGEGIVFQGVCLEEAIIGMEGRSAGVGGQVLHGVVPHTGAFRVVTGGRERLGKGLDYGVLAEGKGEDHRQHAKDGHLARGPRGIEMETVDARLSVRAEISRGVERARDKATPGEAQSDAVIMGDEDDDVPSSNVVGKGDRGGVGKRVAEAGQEDRVTIRVGRDERAGDNYHLLAGNNQPLDSRGGVQKQGQLHVVGSAGTKELSSLSGRRGSKGISVGEGC
jgi:hypothetical protein